MHLKKFEVFKFTNIYDVAKRETGMITPAKVVKLRVKPREEVGQNPNSSLAYNVSKVEP